MPQGFFRSGSASGAMPGTSEARLAWFSFRSPRWWGGGPELANAAVGAARASPPVAAISTARVRVERRFKITHPCESGSLPLRIRIIEQQRFTDSKWRGSHARCTDETRATRRGTGKALTLGGDLVLLAG